MAETSEPDSTELTAEETVDSKPKTSPLLILAAGALSAFLLGMCCLCGGAIWWFKPQVHEDAERAQQLVAEIVDITIPEAYQPRGTIEWNVAFAMNLRGVYYERFIGDGVLTLVEVTSRFRSDEDVQRHIRRTLLEKGGGGAPLVIDAAETTRREFTIRGEQIPFTFEIGRDPQAGTIFHIVEGVFQGKNGEVLFALRVNAEHWDEPSVIKMLESIGGQN